MYVEARSQITVAVAKQSVRLLHICVCACLSCVPGNVGLRACSFAYQNATRMRHFVSSFQAYLAPPQFSTLSHTWHDFRGEKFVKHQVCTKCTQRSD